MADVDKVVRDGKVAGWQARWRDPDGRQRKRTFPRKTDAEGFLSQVRAEMDAGRYVDPSAGRILVRDYAREWISARPHRQSTARRVASLVEVHLAGTRLGGMRIGAVRPSDVQAWASDRATVLSPSTLRNLAALVRSIFAAAVLDRVIGVSPVVRLALPRSERARVVPLTVAQVRDLAAAMPGRNRAMVLAQAGLGLRIGELLALRVEDVDFLRRTVHVRTQLAPGAKVRSDPKTPRSIRLLPLPQVVADALAAHLAEFPPGDDGSIFTTRFGTPYRHDYYGTRIFQAAVAAAALPAGTTSHDLRHHYASVLLAAGESVVAVAERLGHENANLVLSTYGHLMPDSEERTRAAVDGAWSCALDVPSATPTEG